MAYSVGVDLGTTFSAAAVVRDGRAEIVTLDYRSATIPSVLFLREDGGFVVGDAANRRGLTEPGRVAREFKRRFGDTVPLLLGGIPWSADMLTVQLLRHVVAAVAEREGGAPSSTAVTHPANWGPYKVDLLRQAVGVAGLEGARLVPEPEAAAIAYTAQERVEPGEVVAVYDLGGGTFDAAVLRKRASGFEVLGEPSGIERLGGIDFDQAVLAHVTGFLGDALAALDPNDPATLGAMARLRNECVDAKEALSTDTEATIAVMLPTVQTDIRITRAEFEAMIRPTLVETVGALGRALRSAAVEPDDVKAVLLVGGSSRIPLVAQLVAAEVGRPVALDVHPKHAVAVGAALAALAAEEQGSATVAAPPPAAVERAEQPPPAAVDRAEPVDAAPAPAAPVEPVAPPAPAAARRGRRAVVAAAAVAVVAAAVVVALLVANGGGTSTQAGGGRGTTVTTAPPATTTTVAGVHVVVPGTSAWVDTHVALVTGQQVTVDASGTVFHDVARGRSTGPDGDPASDVLQYDVVPAATHAGLIGKVGVSGKPFLLGSHVQFISPADGNLFLGINDVGLDSNGGQFDVTVTTVRS